VNFSSSLCLSFAATLSAVHAASVVASAASVVAAVSAYVASVAFVAATFIISFAAAACSC
jgi:hypothetical protein